MAFTQANASQACILMLPKSVSNSVAKMYRCVSIGPGEESEITRGRPVHNAEILPATSRVRQK